VLEPLPRERSNGVSGARVILCIEYKPRRKLEVVQSLFVPSLRSAYGSEHSLNFDLKPKILGELSGLTCAICCLIQVANSQLDLRREKCQFRLVGSRCPKPKKGRRGSKRRLSVIDAISAKCDRSRE
jgi:hypothetical protein